MSKSYGGKVHDFSIHEKSALIPIKTKIYADSGYQGLFKIICKNYKEEKMKVKFKQTAKALQLYFV